MNVSHLYKITHKPTGYFYYGKHNGWTQNNTGTATGLYWGSGKALKELISKYGKKDLSYDILCYGEPEYILKLEKKLVNKELISERLCLNLSVGGYGSPMQDEKLRKEHSERMKGKMIGDKNPMRNQDNYKKWLSVVQSDEHRKNMSKVMKGKTSGMKHTEEQKQKISLKNRKMHKFISPDGEIVERLGLQSFVDEFGLNKHGLSMVNAGSYSHHKGWRKVK